MHHPGVHYIRAIDILANHSVVSEHGVERTAVVIPYETEIILQSTGKDNRLANHVAGEGLKTAAVVSPSNAMIAIMRNIEFILSVGLRTPQNHHSVLSRAKVVTKVVPDATSILSQAQKGSTWITPPGPRETESSPEISNIETPAVPNPVSTEPL